MVNTPPLPHFLDSFFSDVGEHLQAPAWLKSRLEHQLVLLLNHVLMQEDEAMRRLALQKGRTAKVQWRGAFTRIILTPAGLLDLVPESNPQEADLNITITQTSALALARQVIQAEKPDIHIEGDVKLAAEVHWIIENVRWDVEEDLARLIGDVPAHTLGEVARSIREGIRKFSSKARL